MNQNEKGKIINEKNIKQNFTLLQTHTHTHKPK